MRRHYRNHSIAATAEVNPPRHSSGRRPNGYPREHPGRESRTMFHISPRRSPHSAASVTEDDDDGEGMEIDSDSGDDSGFDEDDGEDMPFTASPVAAKSLAWSVSPSPPPALERPDHVLPRRNSYPFPPVSRLTQSPLSNSRHLGSTYAHTFRHSTISTTLRPAFR